MEERDSLREYVERHTEEAFTRLIESHVDLVHSTARRLVGDADLAKDVCQSVFLLLARKASTVRKTGALAGWLYRATCYEAASLIRREQRRRDREREAMRRSELNSNDTASAWASISPVLEAAMGQLKPIDQNALLLRFFENKPLAEVGQALGLSEEAARKRVSRSLDQLQGYFERRGIGIASGSLASMLAAHALEAAPPGLAASLSTAALSAGTATGAAGVLTTLTPALLMTKTTGTILTVLVLGAVVAPILLRNSPSTSPANQSVTAAPGAGAPAGSSASPVDRRTTQSPVAGTGATSLMGRVATLPPLTPDQIEAYVGQNKRNAESLLAAWRASTNRAYLTEAARRFPADPDVQYGVIVSRAFPEVQRQWIDAYKVSSPDNSLPWYFSALEHYRAGDSAQAAQDLIEATRKPAFRAELAPTLQAMEELQVSAGRATDEARIVAFQESAQVPHLGQMRELAQAAQNLIDQFRQRGDTGSVDQLAGAGLMLGSHLSAGSGSQTLINQLVGIAIEQKFLQQLDPSAVKDPFGRPLAEVRSSIENHRAALKEHAKSVTAVLVGLDDVELANYMERVKLYGEESALVWVKAKHGAR